MIADVQSWLANSSGNYGWMIVNQSESAASTARTFYSSEVATAAYHPQLEITYAAVPEPGKLVLALGASSCCLLIANRRTRAEEC